MVSVHPRVGGEHDCMLEDYATTIGSSPRGRGTQARFGLEPAVVRFIPAWAGNTRHLAKRIVSISVHPRVGGEHLPLLKGRQWSSGSSPRGRGTPVFEMLIEASNRFIPAWAGNTRSSAARPLSWPVHPRVGGEHADAYTALTNSGGSSPRGRGTRAGEPAHRRACRFIPAWAGNTRPEKSGSG